MSANSDYVDVPPEEQPTITTQLAQRFLQLAGQLDALQSQVNRLTASMAHERSQIDVLINHLGKEAVETDPLQDRLVELTEQMSAHHEQFAFLSRKLTELATQEQMMRLATMMATQKQVMELGEVLSELTRAQQRSNELAETRGRQVTDVLTTVQAFLNRRSQFEAQEIVLDTERLEGIRREARGEFAAQFLPAIDGLETALEEGRTLLARHRQDLADVGQAQSGGNVTHPQNERTNSSGNLVHRLRSRLSGDGESADQTNMPPVPTLNEATSAATALNAWLRTLALMRDRFLALMAQEGIQPIQSLKQPFDPRLHVVVQSESRNDLPPNTVTREMRRGYRQGNRVLRYAEVVVSRVPANKTSGTPPTFPPAAPQ